MSTNEQWITILSALKDILLFILSLGGQINPLFGIIIIILGITITPKIKKNF